MRFLSIVSLTALILPSFGMLSPGQLNVQGENVKDEILSYSSSNVAPLYSSIDAEEISDNYIVVFKDDVNIMNFNKHHTWLLNLLQTTTNESEEKINHIFDLHSQFRGYAGKFTRETIEKIRTSDEVAYVEKDQIVHAYDVDTNAPWGLSRIAHRAKPTSEEEYKKYPYNEAAGRNVTVYIIDTGVNVNHVDFEGRAVWGATIPEDDEDVDGNGHGTHVAGTVAGKKYGVAKKANIVAVKVLRSNGSGSMSDVIKGIEFAVQHHNERVAEAKKLNDEAGEDDEKIIVKSAANMSLGGGRSRALDRVVDAAVKAGIQFAVAAGNDGMDACNYSPAASVNAITVGATTMEDRMAWFSNHGSCVDVFAPGHYITSTWIGSNVATNTISGTSMASPHVAGLIALLLSMPEYENKTPEEIKKVIIDMSTPDVIKGLPFWTESANRLIYSNPPKEE
jgi:cerevisin